MSYNQFTGDIPESIFNLDKLNYLDLSGNPNLGGSITNLSNLLDLEYFFIWGCNFSVSIPESIGDMTSLIRLDLGYNQLASIPPSICEIIFDNTAYVFIFNNNVSRTNTNLFIISSDRFFYLD